MKTIIHHGEYWVKKSDYDALMDLVSLERRENLKSAVALDLAKSAMLRIRDAKCDKSQDCSHCAALGTMNKIYAL